MNTSRQQPEADSFKLIKAGIREILSSKDFVRAAVHAVTPDASDALLDTFDIEEISIEQGRDQGVIIKRKHAARNITAASLVFFHFRDAVQNNTPEGFKYECFYDEFRLTPIPLIPSLLKALNGMEPDR